MCYARKPSLIMVLVWSSVCHLEVSVMTAGKLEEQSRKRAVWGLHHHISVLCSISFLKSESRENFEW